MKKMLINSTMIIALSSFFVFGQSVSASEIEGENTEISSDETELLEFNLENDTYEEVTFEEEDGTMATISLSKELIETDNLSTSGQVGLFSLRYGYRFRYRSVLNSYSFVTLVSGSPLKISRLYDFQYSWKTGKVKSTSIKKLSSKNGHAQLVIDVPSGGTKTETANVQLKTSGKSSTHHLFVTRNGNSKGVKLSD